MHLGVVLSVLSKYVDYLTARVFVVGGPVGDSDYSFVAGLSAFELAFGDEYIVGEEFGVGVESRYVSFDSESSDKLLVIRLDNFKHLAFGFLAFAVGCDKHLYAVAVESVHRVAFGYKYEVILLAVEYYTVFAVAAA